MAYTKFGTAGEPSSFDSGKGPGSGWLASSIVVLCLVTQTRAQDSAALSSKFEASIQGATALSQVGKWRQAQKAWLTLLRDHAGAEYARPRLPDIREALYKAAFWSSHRRPPEKSLVSGQLRTYVRSSGRIEVEYGKNQLDDFETVNQLLIHPLHFRDKYSIEVEAPTNSIPVLFLCLEEDRGYGVQLNHRYGGFKIIRLEGDKQIELENEARNTRTGGRQGKVSKVKATVTKTQITVMQNGRQILKVKKVDDAFGQFGVLSPAEFKKITISGIASNSWIEGVVDASMQKQWTAFEEGYKEPKEFSAWSDETSQNIPAVSLEEAASNISLPDQFTPEQLAEVEEIIAILDAGQFHKALLKLRIMEDRHIPAASREFLLAQAELQAGRYKRAVEHLVASASHGEPAFEQRRLHARLLIPVEEKHQAIERFQAMLEERADDPRLHYELAEILMMAGRTADARKRVEEGLALFPSQTDLVTLMQQIVKIEQGPPWRHKFQTASDNFLVVTELSKAVSKSASRELEEAWEYYEKRFGELTDDSERTPVYLFSGEAGYKEYIADIAYEAPANTAGIYSSRLGQILVWNLASDERIEHTLRHEALHRYVHLRLGRLPIWFNEGLAEFVAHAKVKRREWVEGTPSSYWSRVLGSYDLQGLPLLQFLQQEREAFMANAQINYALSWALVDFLLTGDESNRAFFDQLWTILEGNIDPGTALAEALEDRNLQALEKGFGAHLKKIQAR